MPELAEVELSRRFWEVARGESVEEVRVHAGARIFREIEANRLGEWLEGRVLEGSRAHGKRMFFEFSGEGVLEVHLGMSGRMFSRPQGLALEKHDHLVLGMQSCDLVLNDYRMFGKVVWTVGEKPWEALPTQVQESGFTQGYFEGLVAGRKRAVLKAILLDQAVCPGVGNWMADEVCWRMGVYPGVRMGEVDLLKMRKELRFVCKGALRHVADANEQGKGKGFSPGNYVERVPPKRWLFQHRWKKGGRCPRCAAELSRETVAGRTTAWCESCQKA